VLYISGRCISTDVVMLDSYLGTNGIFILGMES